jgi:hypothetical protein
VTISLAVGALCNVPFLFRRFKCYFTLLEVFDEEDVLIVWDRLQGHKELGERELGMKLLNIPKLETVWPNFSISALMSAGSME